MVEFALVIPILVVLFVAVADFGRIFAAGVVVEGATRDAAEAAAQRYVANPPGDLNSPAPTPGDSAYYEALHVDAAKAACVEARSLPNTDYDAITQTCPTWPVIEVCVHDGADPQCGSTPSGFNPTVPAECDNLTPPPTNAQVDPATGNPAAIADRWVEVRTCYKFTSILQLPLMSFGDFYIQRTRSFIVPCYFFSNTPSACGR
jgi:hypothetical protein